MTGSAAPSERERLERFVAGFADERPIAVGWGTVELDRAIAHLSSALGIAPTAFAVAPDCQWLGAWCRVARDALDGLTIVIMEPATEGRLAATLARHDEGPCAIWLAAPATGAGTVATRSPGPFGPERLLDGPRHGPHRLAVVPPGTIAS